jgi:hypothetical protein
VFNAKTNEPIIYKKRGCVQQKIIMKKEKKKQHGETSVIELMVIKRVLARVQ